VVLFEPGDDTDVSEAERASALEHEADFLGVGVVRGSCRLLLREGGQK
jgi:hypothetical protein